MKKMPNIVEADKMRKFARCEITYEELTGGRKDVRFDECELTLDDFIDSIEIDDYFVEFCQFLKKNDINLVILSDGFDLFIQKILEKNDIKNVKFYANHFLHNEDGSFSIEFPFYNPACEKKAGMCKCAMVKEQEFCYIGDGTSDLCIAQKAKILFATKSLKDYCKKHSLIHYPFNSFRDIIELLKKEEV